MDILGMEKERRELDDGAGSGGDTGPQVRALLADGSCDLRALSLTLVVHDHTRVV